ncbi:hypothetical protein M0811_14470 [Anaeramoeba ignava]|uniref:Uncharacterized protein n=1 Tax=Anaeramoeba ignava TaxID=1746090 RepID=A0A9Q0RI80_ANAIG|nr:hypothetical protein M0811_14470 [Anaeramoeba ignava]
MEIFYSSLPTKSIFHILSPIGQHFVWNEVLTETIQNKQRKTLKNKNIFSHSNKFSGNQNKKKNQKKISNQEKREKYFLKGLKQIS